MTAQSASRPGRPKVPRDTGTQCLAAAEIRFARSGFEGTSLRDIAADVGVSSSTVIHHFGTKERLYGMILDSLGAQLEQYVEAPEQPSMDAVILMFERFLTWTIDNPNHAQLLLRELMENQARVPHAKRLHFRSLIGKYVDCIRKGQESGAFRTIDAEMFSLYTLGAITHFAAAVPTTARLLDHTNEETIERYRLTLRANIAAMLDDSVKTKRNRSQQR